MKHEIEVYRKRFEVFARDVLAPAIWRHRQPATVEACPADTGLSVAEVERHAFEPVQVGWRWGPRWSRCWFRVSGRLPEHHGTSRPQLRFACGTEATIHHAGTPVRGLDVNRDSWTLPADAVNADGSYRVLIEAQCIHPWGVSVFEWDGADTRARWEGEHPGHLTLAETAVRDESAWALHRAFTFATGLLGELDPASQRAAELYAALRDAADRVPDDAVREHAPAALEQILGVLRRGASPSAPIGHAVGHAHIDTAWLWTLDTTRQKVIRSWSNAAELIETTDDFTMLASQAVQYRWLEDDAPGLFARVRRAVESGRWEPYGGMWVEPDAGVPSGESLVRQMLLGCRYWRDRFGDRGHQHTLFLPDTFSFPACLPGIMLHGGLDTFITNKMSWNQFNTIPMTSFRWKGLGDETVLAHLTPGGDYNSTCSPRELRKAERNIVGRERIKDAAPAEFLQPYGFGDGGGGPTEGMAEHVRLSASTEGLPRMKHSSGGAFRDSLAELDERVGGLPRWHGELYLELHRATTTTQGWLKSANHRCEQKLRLAEWLLSAGPSLPDGKSLAAVQTELERCWQLVLLNQFHDILPGSSIKAVYDEARAQLDEVEATLDRLISEQEQRWSEGGTGPAILNPASHEQAGVVEVDGRLRFVGGVPGMGVAKLENSANAPESVRVEPTDRGVRLANGVIEAEIDRAGRVVSLRRVGSSRDAAERGPLNELVVYEDRPMMWDAWDIERYLHDKTVWRNDTDAERVASRTIDGVRGEVEVTLRVGDQSHAVQVFQLDAGSGVLRVHTTLDWHESKRLLKAEHAAAISSDRVTCGIQFGHLERPTHENTSWDRARFEWPAQRWVDLSEPGLGLGLLSAGKYGHSCRHNRLGLTLARSPLEPDSTADRGEHRFVYALMPHDGDWRAAGVDREGEALGRPLRVVSGGPAKAPFHVETEGHGSVEVSACKVAEDDAGSMVLRLVEVRGGRCEAKVRWGLGVASVERVNGLEDPIPGDSVRHSGGETVITFQPFEIVAVRVKRNG